VRAITVKISLQNSTLQSISVIAVAQIHIESYQKVM